MRDFGYVATVTAVEAPTVLVLLVGIVLTATAGRRLPRRPRLLALSGLGVLLVTSALSLAWIVLMPRMFTADWGRSNFQLVNTAYGVVQGLAYPLGLGLVIAAALTGRRAGDAQPGPWGGWPPGGPAPAPTGQPAPTPGWTADASAAPGAPGQWGGRSRPDGTGGAGPL